MACGAPGLEHAVSMFGKRAVKVVAPVFTLVSTLKYPRKLGQAPVAMPSMKAAPLRTSAADVARTVAASRRNWRDMFYYYLGLLVWYVAPIDQGGSGPGVEIMILIIFFFFLDEPLEQGVGLNIPAKFEFF